MIRGDDFLQREKAQTDAEITMTLNDPKISEDVKAKKYNWLYKKRRQLKHELENRPQRVIIDEGKTSEVAPYLQESISPTHKPKVINEEQEEPRSNIEPNNTLEASTSKTKILRNKFSTPFKGIIAKRYSNELENYVKENAEKFRIRKNGSFESNIPGTIVKHSNFTDVLEYDPLVKEMIRETRRESSTEESSTDNQTGTGKRRKRVLVKVLPINSPGLESQTLPDEDEEKWTPPLPEENIEEHRIIEEGTEEEYTQEEPLQESQAIEDKDEEWSPPLAEEDPLSIPPSTANLIEDIVKPISSISIYSWF
uniref:Uncharacterized protein n=1 Tax=Meloidogyne floridensis TaxID=298350 RepID=A0A915P5A1_9BILA